MTELEKILVRLVVDRTGFTAGLQQSQRETKTWGDIVTGVFQGVGQRITDFAATAVRVAVQEFNRSIDAASDLGESLNKTSVVFGQNAADVVRWSKTTANAFGQSQRGALEAAGTFGNLFTSLGVGRDAAAEMSMGLVELASDLASFNNIDPTEALEKLRAGIVGETEPLRTLGINLSAAAVEAKAMEMGLAASTKELTEQDKVLARYNIMLQQSANARGDFARTAESAANAERRVAAQLDNYRTMAGRVFLPFREQSLGILADVLQRMAPYAENIMQQFAAGLARGLVAITPVLVQLKNLFVYWLKPGSPPRLLPDLTRWGLGAANAWLEGWTKGDFNILSSINGTVRGLLGSMVSSGKMGEGGLFGAIMGSRSALASAVAEFASTGNVSEDTFRKIRESAGGAGQQVEALTRAYFDLEKASRATQQAQSELTAVQERYNKALKPITDEMSDIDARRQEILDRQRIDELKRTIGSRNASADDKELARLELRQIELRRQKSLLEEERDTAVDAAQQKLEAAQTAEKAAQEALDLQRAAIQQEEEYNGILADRQRLLDQMAAEARRAYEQMQADAQRAYQAAQADAERLANAQLAYRLAVADTPEQIKILNGELGKYTEGQAEYWQILTQIRALEERLKSQRASGGGGLGGTTLLPELPDPVALGETGQGVQALMDAMNGLAEALGISEEARTFEEDVDNMMEHVMVFTDTTERELAPWMQDIKDMFRLIKAVSTGDWGEMWDAMADITERMAAGEESAIEEHHNALLINFLRNKGNITGTMQDTWDESAELSRTAYANMDEDQRGWIDGVRLRFEEAGGGWMGALLQALQLGWQGIKLWWDSLTLPWEGLSLPSWLGGGDSGSGFSASTRGAAVALPSAGSSTTMYFSPVINISGNADPAATERAVRSAGDDFLREWQARGNS